MFRIVQRGDRGSMGWTGHGGTELHILYLFRDICGCQCVSNPGPSQTKHFREGPDYDDWKTLADIRNRALIIFVLNIFVVSLVNTHSDPLRDLIHKGSHVIFMNELSQRIVGIYKKD